MCNRLPGTATTRVWQTSRSTWDERFFNNWYRSALYSCEDARLAPARFGRRPL